jgi:guanylate kinase
MSTKVNPRLKQQELIEYALSIGEYYGVKLDFAEKSLKK